MCYKCPVVTGTTKRMPACFQDKYSQAACFQQKVVEEPDVDGEGDVDVRLGPDGAVHDGVPLAGHAQQAPLA